MSARRGGAGALDLGGLTPLLDTVFLLLFALLTLSRNAEDTELVRVELPVVDAEGEGEPGGGPRLVLAIDAGSVIRLGAEPDGAPIATRARLDAVLAVALAAELGGALPEEVTVEIQADADARQGVAVELLQHLRLAGYRNVELLAVGLATDGGAFGARTEESPAGDGEPAR